MKQLTFVLCRHILSFPRSKMAELSESCKRMCFRNCQTVFQSTLTIFTFAPGFWKILLLRFLTNICNGQSLIFGIFAICLSLVKGIFTYFAPLYQFVFSLRIESFYLSWRWSLYQVHDFKMFSPGLRFAFSTSLIVILNIVRFPILMNSQLYFFLFCVYFYMISKTFPHFF